MIRALRQTLSRSIQAKLALTTGAVLVGVVCLLVAAIALAAARTLRHEADRQLSQGLEQSAALLNNFLDVREANLKLWIGNPLVGTIFSDPAIAAVFEPSLRNYFAKFREQEPWIREILLIREKTVIYNDTEIFEFSDNKDGADGIANLAAIPAQGVAVLDSLQLSPSFDGPVLVLKRHLSRDGALVEGAYIVLILDFGQICNRLFGQFEIGRQGFISVAAKAHLGGIALPHQPPLGSEERKDFLSASRQWRSIADIPEQYGTIVLKKMGLAERPFTIVGVASINDIREPVVKLVYFSTGLGMLGLAIGIWCAIYFSRRLTGPIRTLTVEAEQLASSYTTAQDQGAPSVGTAKASPDGPAGADNDGVAPVEQIDNELDRLARSFARMQDAIRGKIEVIEAQNERLRKSDLLKEELNQSLERKVQERTRQLEQSLETQKAYSDELLKKGEALENRTVALSESHRKLENTLHELRTAHAQLIQSEKMASLGQLVANVAHEINTPIAAVKASGKNIADALEQFHDSAPRFTMLDQATRRLFGDLVGHARERREMLSSREERAIVRELARRLDEAGIADGGHKAALLVQLNAQAVFADYLPLLRHAESELILGRALSMATLINSADNINIAVDRVAKIVFALKSFSRVDNRGEMVTASLQEGLETVLTIYHNQIKRGVELVSDYEDVPPLRCLPDELNQVWTNLIHNALQAMNYAGTLKVGIRRTENDAVVSIADTGCGIPDEIRDKIFDPFFTTKPTGEGSGLGLDIVKKIVDKHRGRIEVRSQIGVGTTFVVFLPFVQA